MFKFILFLGIVYYVAKFISGNDSNNANNNPHYTQDDIIYKDGKYYENEFSEDWEEFEYEIDKEKRNK